MKKDAANDMPRQKIVLRRRVTPQQVKLPHGQSFLARCKRVSWQNLPRNVTVRQIVPRKKKCKTQKGGKLLGTIGRLGTKALTSTGLLKKGLGAGAKAINSDIGKKLVEERIKHAPEFYHLRSSKIKNKNVRKTLESEVAKCVVQEAQKKQQKT